MSNCIIIDGVYGQDGAYLSRYLLENGETNIVGITRRSGSGTDWRHKHLGIDGKIKIEYCDITETHLVDSLIKKYQPKEYYHLAAQSFVKSSFDQPYATIIPNCLGTLNILEAIRSYSPETKLYNAGSSEQFGRVLETPQSEKTPFNPVSPYGASKCFAYDLVRIYRESYNLFACSGILFNHESRLRGREFVTRKITSGLVNWLNKKEPVVLGNLDAKRDWGHSEDYVTAMSLMLHQDKPQDYVIATGKTYSIRDFIERCLKYLMIDYTITNQGTIDEQFVDQDNAVIVSCSKDFYRENELDILIGDASKANKELAWYPSYDIDMLIQDMLNYEWQ
jgi:GDPmannose 4,6-dehydratase